MAANTITSEVDNILSTKIDGTNESLESKWVVSKIESILGDNFKNIITDQDIYLSSALYLIYWYHRTENHPWKQKEMLHNIHQYFYGKDLNHIMGLLEDIELKDMAFEHVEGWVLIKPTVDIVITRNDNTEILTLERNIFPKWPALIGGLINDEDEDNILGLETKVFSVLRIAWEKIIGGEVKYGEENECFFVSNPQQTIILRLSKEKLRGYKYKDKVTRMVWPSDPRHMVDTEWFTLEIEGDINQDHLSWIKKNQVLDLNQQNWWLAFSHHRQIISETTKEKNEIDSANISHHKWIRNIIKNPLDWYSDLKTRFENNNNNAETPCPELLPIVTKMIEDLYDEKINTLCKNDEFALAQRYLVDNALKHSFTEKDNICPYKSTLHAIIDGIKFFDIIARMDMWFYKDWKTDVFNEQDPRKQQYAYFFNHKYKNHVDQILAKFPDEIIIPTYEHLWATDLMKVRWIPIRFIWLSNDFLYVDEFWQSPLEFFGHDWDHSVRMAYEDEKYCIENNINREEFIETSTQFWNDYLKGISIKKTDTEEEKELKKLKKLILFEITHEDSKPFMKDVIVSSILTEEWFDIHRENIITDPDTGYMKRERSVEVQWWISPLSFLLHKLQHGFFDQIDSQITQIVSPHYRTAEYIAKAAQGILKDLWYKDDTVSYEWLLQRTCSKSPYKVHNKDFQDPSIKKYGDWTRTDK